VEEFHTPPALSLYIPNLWQISQNSKRKNPTLEIFNHSKPPSSNQQKENLKKCLNFDLKIFSVPSTSSSAVHLQGNDRIK
jgi:hypothetical protein